MKRILLIILAVFYVGVSNGATVYFHYCMGELVKLGITESKQDSCDFCGMPPQEAGEKSCCKDETKLIKVDDSQKMAQSHIQFEQAPVIIPNNIPWLIRDISIPLQSNKAALSNAPPEGPPVPVFIRNCTFRI